MSLRIAIKCSWSGARFTIPSSSLTLTSKTTLLEIMETIRSSLPPSIFDNGELLFVRNCIKCSDWEKTTLKSLGIDTKNNGGGGVLFTLKEGSSALTAAASVEKTEAMEVDEPDDNNNKNTPSKALELLLASNFDADSKECIVTLCKLVDNVIAKPGNEKVRMIRLTNEAFDKKVGRKRGGVEFLLACGFTYKPPTSTPLLTPSTAIASSTPEYIELLPQNESTTNLISARKLLSQKAVSDLNMKSSDLPSMKAPPPPPPTVTSNSGGNNNNNTFNPYKTLSYNTQSAAAGAPNPNQIGSDGTNNISTTEKKLNALKSKQERLEKKMQIIDNRGLVATKPGENVGGSIVSLESGGGGGGNEGGGGGGGKSDGALLAARMKRMEEERKKREEGGFTTKAMRDLEKMKKQKVYSHTQLRINFSDGCSLHSKFLPSEKVSTVKEIITSALHSQYQSVLKFDLYVAPPRRMLDVNKRLDEEGLVPAAKVHVSWKVDGAPPPSSSSSVGDYIISELFQNDSVGSASTAAAAYPDAKKIVDEGKKVSSAKKQRSSADSSSSGNTKSSREEAMMQRMMGMKPKGLMGKSSSNKGGSKSGGGGGGGKPKWFKG